MLFFFDSICFSLEYLLRWFIVKYFNFMTNSTILFRFQIPQKPIYINLIRRPIDRLVSYYYFLRYGDNYRPNLVRRKAGDKMVSKFYTNIFAFWNVFYFCNFSPYVDIRWVCQTKATGLRCKIYVASSAILLWSCSRVLVCIIIVNLICEYFIIFEKQFLKKHFSIQRRPGSEWALEQAKYNLVNHYFLVGVTEEMEDFIYLLELSLPRYERVQSSNSQNSNLKLTFISLNPLFSSPKQ